MKLLAILTLSLASAAFGAPASAPSNPKPDKNTPTLHIKRAGQVVPGRYIVKIKPGAKLPNSSIPAPSPSPFAANHHSRVNVNANANTDKHYHILMPASGGQGSNSVPEKGTKNETAENSAGETNNNNTENNDMLAEETTEGWISNIKSMVGREWKAEHIYGFTGFRGFAADLDPETIQALKGLDLIDYVTEDYIVSASMSITQQNSPWGLARLSSKQPLPLSADNSTATSTAEYVYDASAGAGTCVYVIDTGITSNHTQFQGRASSVANFSSDKNKEDGNGHGTHVAGIVGGKDFGVAKKAVVFGVKVLAADGFGTVSSVIAGIDFVAQDARKRRCPRGVVANLSLGGPLNQPTNDAIRAAVEDSGIFVVVAAGNEGMDADFTSPASESSAFAVAATDRNDTIAKFSNFGPAVDIFAPGVDITSAWVGASGEETQTLSGTSMASPFVAGLAAYLQGVKGKMEPQTLRNEILKLSVEGVVQGLTGERNNTVNRMAFNGRKAGGYASGADVMRRAYL